MYKPFKMMGKSPLMKKLIGKQHKLPAHLKEAIMDSPLQAKSCDCWDGYKRVPGTKPCAKGSCKKA
tara:strand:+ start:314 stop:511 length:198 start_codon:yes stop_codon:yes gene_type:complete